MIINDNQWYLTKLVGEILLRHNHPCYVNDISRIKLVKYFCGTSISTMSMISHEICWWDISVVQVIQVIQLIRVIQVGLAHLWPDFRVILDGSSSDPARHRRTLQARRQLFSPAALPAAQMFGHHASWNMDLGWNGERSELWGLEILVYNTEYFLHSPNQSTPLVVKTLDQAPKIFQMGNSRG